MTAQPREACPTAALAPAEVPAPPAAPGLRLLPVPRVQPDPAPAPGSDPAPGPGPGYVQGTLAVDFRRRTEDSYFGPQATGRADLPELRDWARRLVQVMLEVTDGVRPDRQLRRWVTPEVHRRLARRGLLARQRRQRLRHAPRVRALTVCHPTDGVGEVSAVVVHEGRTRAMALRFVGVDGRWLVTVLELG